MSATGAGVSQGQTGLSDRGSERRQRIIDATLEVIAERGVRGTSHRQVARAAGVPLSATNYYFGTLEGLLEEAFSDAIERDRIAMKERFGKLPPGSDPFPELARLLHELIGAPEKAILSHELVVASVRGEQFRRLALTWTDQWHAALLPLMGDDLNARIAVAFTGGILEYGLIREIPLTVEEIETMLRHALGQAVPASGA